PLQGAVVKVALRPEARIYQSAKTGPKGDYSISELPPGTYDVAVEADGGLYVLSGPLALQPAERRTVSLSVRPDDPNRTDAPDAEPEPPVPGGAEPTEPEKEQPKEPPKEPTEEEKKKKGKGFGGFLRSPWGGATLIVGFAALIGAAAKSSDEDQIDTASPSD
ncbi:MAG: carboxypeptidase-like regulatory domain-containing protein, partial [Candidatus Methylomirabilis sp.]